MKTEINNLPIVHIPGESLVSYNKDDDYYRMCTLKNNSYNFYSKVYFNIYEILQINPLEEYKHLIDNEEFKTSLLVITINNSNSPEPKVIYVWDKNCWRKTENVQTDIS